MFFIRIQPSGNNIYKVFRLNKHIVTVKVYTQTYHGFSITAADTKYFLPFELEFIIRKCKKLASKED